ncbi:MAG: hypothetical protein M0C28_26255 [Candidatus Moduliflexus flocculans]|nr:hypothetical protein [Candidatus Moduliflexus flocculans]
MLGRAVDARSGRGVTVYAFDARERRYVNPMIVLPGLSDDKPPVIRSVALSSGGVETAIDQPKAIRQGSYDMLIDSYDVSPAGAQGAPYDVRVLIDGSGARPRGLRRGLGTGRRVGAVRREGHSRVGLPDGGRQDTVRPVFASRGGRVVVTARRRGLFRQQAGADLFNHGPVTER